MNQCQILGCLKAYYAKGFCGSHYSSSRRKANPTLDRRYRTNARARSLKKLYGISVEDYAQILQAQGFVCAICKSPAPKANSKYFHVDHDHKTQRVRGLLCIECNLGLGKFQDNPDSLKRAAEYLEKSRG